MAFEPGEPTTIAAIATAPGRSATALVRMSGPLARGILASVCPTLTAVPPDRRQTLTSLRHPETMALVDRALVTFFEGPNSYTGEDTVEISCHGGMLSPQLVLEALCGAGAVLAPPGEFTRRALENGKLDLLQAEAILDVIEAPSPALHRAAIFQIEKGLSRRVTAVREAVLRVEGMVAYAIDFPEEDEPPVPPARIRAAVEEAVGAIGLLLATAPRGEMLRHGALIVLAGRPNSGKSSLFNALLGVERAIVTEIAGTTRDAIEASLLIDGYPFRLVDTAGLRSTSDRVEEMGIEVAKRFLAGADLVIFCVEGPQPLYGETLGFLEGVSERPLILARTKADQWDPQPDARGEIDSVRVSVQTGEGIASLRQAVLRQSFGPGDLAEEPVVITRERHARALASARDELLSFEAAYEALPPEIAATHLRAAVQMLEDLIGIVTPDDILGEVFGQFCVGK